MDDRDFFNRFSKVPNHVSLDAKPDPVPGKDTPPTSDTSVPPIPARTVPPIPARTVPPVLPYRAVPPVLPYRAVPPVLPYRAVPPVLPYRAVPPVLPYRAVPPIPARTVPPIPIRTVPPVLPYRAVPPVLPYRAVPPVPERSEPPILVEIMPSIIVEIMLPVRDRAVTPDPDRAVPPDPDRAVPSDPDRVVPPDPDRDAPPVPDRISRPMHTADNSANNVTRTYNVLSVQPNMRSTANSAHPPRAHRSRSHTGRISLNMNMDGLDSRFNSHGANVRPMANQSQNPIVVATAENNHNIFDSLENLIQVFHSISILMESILITVQTTHRLTLNVAENYARVKMFLSKYYSVVVSIRRFLTNVLNLLRMIRGGGRGSRAEENLSNATSTTEENVPSDNFTI